MRVLVLGAAKRTAAPVAAVVRAAPAGRHARPRRVMRARVSGRCRPFVDRLNAQRQATYGQLAELAHARADLGLSYDFATSFFLRDARNRQLSLSELEQSILRLRERLQRQEAELARRLEEEDLIAQRRAAQELAEAEAEPSAAETELAAAEQQRIERAARVAALREQTQSQ